MILLNKKQQEVAQTTVIRNTANVGQGIDTMYMLATAPVTVPLKNALLLADKLKDKGSNLDFYSSIDGWPGGNHGLKRRPLKCIRFEGSLCTANRCYDVKGEDAMKLASGMRLIDMCIEPVNFNVEDISPDKTGGMKTRFVPAKLMTRQTYTITNIDGDITVNVGNMKFEEKDGIDYAATTVQVRGGEKRAFAFF
jgi:hypothetical protein